MTLGTVIGLFRHRGAMTSHMRLGQQAVAGLLNAAHPGMDVIYAEAQVIGVIQPHREMDRPSSTVYRAPRNTPLLFEPL
jgi:hypothetical protein